MIEANLYERSYSLPADWSEVTFRDFVEILNMKNDGYVSDNDFFAKSLAILAKDARIYDEIKNLYLEDFKTLKSYFEYLYQDIDKNHPVSSVNEFDINGEKWMIKEDFNRMRTGEMISIELMIQDKNIDLQPMEIAFGVLFRRKLDNGKEAPFNPDDVITIIREHSKHIYVTDVIGKIAFFLNGGKTSTTKNTQVSFKVIPKMNSEECQPKKSKSTRGRKKSI